MSEALLRTPLYEAHLKLKARMVPFAGYEMPVQYTGVLEEAKACRARMALFDVSHMGQFALRGPAPLAALQKLVTNDLSKIAPGQAQYNMLCQPDGGVIDDLIIYRRDEEFTYICVNAGNRAEDLAWMQAHLPKTHSLVDESQETGLIALQGPGAEALMKSVLKTPLATELKYYYAAETKLFGVDIYLSRTGYTGEDGYEIYAPANRTEFLWQSLLEAGRADGLVACGLGARDTLRLEAGYPLHGHELSKTISPLQAGLGWVVKLQMASDFIGKSTLQKEAATGPSRILKALVIEDRRIARQGYPILSRDGRTVGEITSGTQSPHLGAPIALGFVDAKVAGESQFQVQVRESAIPAKVVSLPFVPSRTKRIARPQA